MPKFHLLYFKSLLDIVFSKFFELYGDAFIKQGNRYVLAKSFTAKQLSKLFESLAVDELKKVIAPYDVLNPAFFIIIGACMPKDNVLLKFNSANSLPAKLSKLISSDYSIKYVLKEKDIAIDSIKFNDACAMAFNKLFSEDTIEKRFGKGYKKNVVFIAHKAADCYVMLKLLKSILGKANCINMKAETFADATSPIVAINDLIDKHSQFSKLNNSAELKLMRDEVLAYIQSKTGLIA